MGMFKSQEEKVEEFSQQKISNGEALRKRMAERGLERDEAFKRLKEKCERAKLEFSKKRTLKTHLMFEFGAGRYGANHEEIEFSDVMANFKEYRVVSVIEGTNHSFGSDDGVPYYKLFLELRPEMERFYEAI